MLDVMGIGALEGSMSKLNSTLGSGSDNVQMHESFDLTTQVIIKWYEKQVSEAVNQILCPRVKVRLQSQQRSSNKVQIFKIVSISQLDMRDRCIDKSGAGSLPKNHWIKIFQIPDCLAGQAPLKCISVKSFWVSEEKTWSIEIYFYCYWRSNGSSSINLKVCSHMLKCKRL